MFETVEKIVYDVTGKKGLTMSSALSSIRPMMEQRKRSPPISTIIQLMKIC